MVAVINDAHSSFTVKAPNVQYSSEHITAQYAYKKTLVTKNQKGELIATPQDVNYEFQVDRKVGKTGYIYLTFPSLKWYRLMAHRFFLLR